MSLTAIATVVQLLEPLPEPAQEQMVEHLRECIADRQDTVSELLAIARRLPPERVSQLLDFARFIDFQATRGSDSWLEEETEDEMRASDERWEQLFARPEAKRVMRAMAREAREDYLAGRTTAITLTNDGRLAPA